MGKRLYTPITGQVWIIVDPRDCNPITPVGARGLSWCLVGLGDE
jgi:hypothetical protein